MDILKENGKSEEFDSAKIEASVRNVGRDEQTAHEIAVIVTDRNPKSTKDIRTIVNKELKNRTAEAARTYEESRTATRKFLECRTLVAKTDDNALTGLARLSKEAMANLNLSAGDQFMVMHGTQRHALTAERNDEPSMRWNEIRLHNDDMQKIGASDGWDIVAQRNLL